MVLIWVNFISVYSRTHFWGLNSSHPHWKYIMEIWAVVQYQWLYLSINLISLILNTEYLDNLFFNLNLWLTFWPSLLLWTELFTNLDHKTERIHPNWLVESDPGVSYPTSTCHFFPLYCHLHHYLTDGSFWEDWITRK